MKVANIKAKDVKDAGGLLTLKIKDIRHEELPNFPPKEGTEIKLIFDFEGYDKCLIANNNTLTNMSKAVDDPKKWAGLTVDIATKNIIITNRATGEPKPVDMVYVAKVHGFDPEDLVSTILNKLLD